MKVFVPLIHLVYFGQFKFLTDIEKNPEPSFYVDATRNDSWPVLLRKRCSIGENAEK